MLCECVIPSQVHVPFVFEGDDENMVSGLPLCTSSPKAAHRTHGIYKPHYCCAAILCACTEQSPCQGLVIANFALFPLLNAKVRYCTAQVKPEGSGGALNRSNRSQGLPYEVATELLCQTPIHGTQGWDGTFHRGCPLHVRYGSASNPIFWARFSSVDILPPPNKWTQNSTFDRARQFLYYGRGMSINEANWSFTGH